MVTHVKSAIFKSEQSNINLNYQSPDVHKLYNLEYCINI